MVQREFAESAGLGNVESGAFARRQFLRNSVGEVQRERERGYLHDFET